MQFNDWKQGWYGLPVAVFGIAVFVFGFYGWGYVKAHPGACIEPVNIIRQDERHYACPDSSHVVIVGDHLECRCN